MERIRAVEDVSKYDRIHFKIPVTHSQRLEFTTLSMVHLDDVHSRKRKSLGVTPTILLNATDKYSACSNPVFHAISRID